MNQIQVTGTVDRKGFGTGTWVLVANSGETYELYEPAAELQKKGLKVKVSGTVREDVMTLAMVGPVLQVAHYEVLEA